MERLPDEIIIHLFSFLSVNDFPFINALNKKFRSLTNDSNLWQRFFLKYVGRPAPSSIASSTRKLKEQIKEFHSVPIEQFKIVLVGTASTKTSGKTSFLDAFRLFSDRFFYDGLPKNYTIPNYNPTVFDMYKVKFSSPTSKPIQLTFWDTAGQEDYDRLRPLSYPQTDLFLLFYAVDYASSVDDLTPKWYPEIMHHQPNAVSLLIGTKSDLRNDKSSTCVPYSKIISIVTSYSNVILNWCEISIKANLGISLFANQLWTAIQRIKNTKFIAKPSTLFSKPINKRSISLSLFQSQIEEFEKVDVSFDHLGIINGDKDHYKFILNPLQLDEFFSKPVNKIYDEIMEMDKMGITIPRTNLDNVAQVLKWFAGFNEIYKSSMYRIVSTSSASFEGIINTNWEKSQIHGLKALISYANFAITFDTSKLSFIMSTLISVFKKSIVGNQTSIFSDATQLNNLVFLFAAKLPFTNEFVSTINLPTEKSIIAFNFTVALCQYYENQKSKQYPYLNALAFLLILLMNQYSWKEMSKKLLVDEAFSLLLKDRIENKRILKVIAWQSENIWGRYSQVKSCYQMALLPFINN